MCHVKINSEFINAVASDPALVPTEKVLYMLICANMEPSGFLRMSFKELAKKIGYVATYISARPLPSLKKNGYIDIFNSKGKVIKPLKYMELLGDE